jgi:hypothetical protein
LTHLQQQLQALICEHWQGLLFWSVAFDCGWIAHTAAKLAAKWTANRVRNNRMDKED